MALDLPPLGARRLRVAALTTLAAGGVAYGAAAGPTPTPAPTAPTARVVAAAPVGPLRPTLAAATTKPDKETPHISLSNSRPNAAILSMSRMVPRSSAAGTVTVANTSKRSGAFSLSPRVTADVAGPRGGRLAGRLEVLVQDERTRATAYAGPLSAMGRVSLGSWTPGEGRSYLFTVRFPASASPRTPDDLVQGSSTTVEFLWDAVETKG